MAYNPSKFKLLCKLMITVKKTSVCEKWQSGYSKVEGKKNLCKLENWTKYDIFPYVNSKQSEFGLKYTAEWFFCSNISSS